MTDGIPAQDAPIPLSTFPYPVHLDVLDCMGSHGGSFVQALSEAWRRADQSNSARLAAAFEHYYRSYEQMLGNATPGTEEPATTMPVLDLQRERDVLAETLGLMMRTLAFAEMGLSDAINTIERLTPEGNKDGVILLQATELTPHAALRAVRATMQSPSVPHEVVIPAGSLTAALAKAGPAPEIHEGQLIDIVHDVRATFEGAAPMVAMGVAIAKRAIELVRKA